MKQIVGDSLTEIRPHLVSSYQALLYRRNARGEVLSGKQMMNVPESFSTTGFDELEESLRTYLTVDKGQTRIELYIRKLEQSILTMLQDLQERREFLSSSTVELNEMVQKLSYRKSEYQKVTNTLIERLRINLEQYDNQLKNKALLFGDVLINTVRDAVFAYEGNVGEQAFARHIETVIRRKQRAFLEELHDFIQDIVNTEHNRVLGDLRNVWTDFESSFMPQSLLNSRSMTRQFQTKLPGNFKDLVHETAEKDDNNSFGWIVAATVLGAVVGSFIPIIAGSIYGFFSSRDSAVDEKVRNAVWNDLETKLKENNRTFVEKVLKLYDNVCHDAIEALHNDVDSRLSTVQKQLEEALVVRTRDEVQVAAKSQWLTDNTTLLNEINHRIKAVAFLR